MLPAVIRTEGTGKDAVRAWIYCACSLVVVVEMKKFALDANVIVDGYLPIAPERSSLQFRDFVLLDR